MLELGVNHEIITISCAKLLISFHFLFKYLYGYQHIIGCLDVGDATSKS